jgi:RNA polymerase sigma-70 factor (ECF subfamily)
VSAVGGRAPTIEAGSRELAELIHESSAADGAAFAELYDATASRVYGLAARILRSPAQAEDAALETYLEVWRTSARFSADRSSPIAWILAIVLRRVLDRLGPASAAARHSPRVEAGAVAQDAKASSEEAAQILEALRWLRPGQLEALELACRDRDEDDAEPVHPTAILSTTVDAAMWTGLRRMDGTTYSGSPDPTPERGVSGD